MITKPIRPQGLILSFRSMPCIADMNVHWNSDSDVQAGFVMGSATVARFHSNPVLGLIFGLQQEKWREYEKITLKAIQIAAWS